MFDVGLDFRNLLFKRSFNQITLEFSFQNLGEGGPASYIGLRGHSNFGKKMLVVGIET